MKNAITAHIGTDHFKTILQFGPHTIIADEPEEKGGTDLAPAPSTLLKMSLAACTAITLRMYADRKGWDLEEVNIEVDFEKTENGTLFHIHILVKGNLDETQIKRLTYIAHACPVHKILTNPIDTQIVVNRSS